MTPNMTACAQVLAGWICPAAKGTAIGRQNPKGNARNTFDPSRPRLIFTPASIRRSVPPLLKQAEIQVARGIDQAQRICAVGSRESAAGRPTRRRGQIAILLQTPARDVLPIDGYGVAGMRN